MILIQRTIEATAPEPHGRMSLIGLFWCAYLLLVLDGVLYVAPRFL